MFAGMDAVEKEVAAAEADLQRALELLSKGARHDVYTWALIAGLIGEADLAVRAARARLPRLHVPLLDQAVQALRDDTNGFTDPDFLRATRPERRRNPDLFRPG